MKLRKQTEAAPPSCWMRSKTGMPFKIVKTSGVNAADEWLYRADYGNVKSSTLWSLTDLEREGCTFITEQPDDWQLSEWRR